MNSQRIKLTPIELTRTYEQLFIKNQTLPINLNSIATLIKNSILYREKISNIFLTYKKNLYLIDSNLALTKIKPTKTKDTHIITTTIKDPIKVGHIIASLKFSANLLGWQIKQKNYLTITPQTDIKPPTPNLLPSPYLATEIIQNISSPKTLKPSYIKKIDFLDILNKALDSNIYIFDGFSLNLDFTIFVNRVDGMQPGMYNKYLHLIEKEDFTNTLFFITNKKFAKNSAFTIFITSKDINDTNKITAGMIGEILQIQAGAKGLKAIPIKKIDTDLSQGLISNNFLYGFSIGAI